MVEQDKISERESGLNRQLSTSQLTMIALGGAIGTGLFLGSGVAVGYAGPAVLISYAVAALLAIMMMYSLSEMTVAHPTVGAFGSYAEMYVGKWAGFVVRYMYWAAVVIVTGGEATAAAIYMSFWFPDFPRWIWVILFSLIMISINSISVKNFGIFEYWFAMIKVIAIILFIILGLALIFGIGVKPVGISNLTAHGGFAPNGWFGVWMGLLMAIFSFDGVEVIAVSSGEAKEPERAVPRAMRTMVLRIFLFYLLSLAIMLAVLPWNMVGAKVVTESPFVIVLNQLGIPAAADIMNFVVVTAALSAMNTHLYMGSRTLFSLSRAGYAPHTWGKITARGVPLHALLISSIGMGVAVILNMITPAAYNNLVSMVLFSILFIWIMIFVTHLFFRPRTRHLSLPVRAPLFPFAPIIGIVVLTGVLLTMAFDSNWVSAWYFGAPFLLFLLLTYYVLDRRKISYYER